MVLPAGERLIEPFAGSGALFLNTDFDAYLLADANADLIHLFRHVQCEGPEFIDYCRSYFTPTNNQPAVYYALRQLFNDTTDVRLRSAL
ncbi:MAG: DNA adenine methylase, partial [Caldilineaceae bacterium]|nr:DNA adenine methylase [Caldilineaceae bacterium]